MWLRLGHHQVVQIKEPTGWKGPPEAFLPLFLAWSRTSHTSS